MNTDSLEQLKDHDTRLTQVKRALLLQQHNLRNTLNNLKKMKKSMLTYEYVYPNVRFIN